MTPWPPRSWTTSACRKRPLRALPPGQMRLQIQREGMEQKKRPNLQSGKMLQQPQQQKPTQVGKGGQAVYFVPPSPPIGDWASQPHQVLQEWSSQPDGDAL